jgi:lipid A 3-O-deacylase
VTTALLLLMPLAVSQPALGDAVGIFAGHGQDTDQYGIGIQLDRGAPVHEYAGSTVTAHVELGVGEFQGHAGSISHNTIRACEALGKVRWNRRSVGSVAPFVEFGLGMGGLSEVTINGDRHFSSSFQFTEALRMGLRLGSTGQFDVAVGAQHFSNAGLSRPNDAITYAGFLVGWRWR